MPCCFLFFYLVTGVEILVSAPERRWAPRTSPQQQKLPAFCRAGWAGRKRWSLQHIPPSRPEPKDTVHPCTVRALTQDEVSSGYEVLVYARLCLLARAVLFPVLLLSHGGRDPRLSAREEVGSPHLPPSTPEPASIQNKVITRDSPTRVLNKTQGMPLFMTHFSVATLSPNSSW